MRIDKKRIRFNILAILLIMIFCFAISPITLQNDTFYTIKIGEYISQNGITMHDPFSFHNIEYTYPHWLYDVGMYFIYSIGGQTGIYVSTIVLCMILGILMYIINVRLTKNRVTSFIITIGAIYLLKDYIAARAQLVTFILFELTIYFIENFLETKKKKYAVGLIIIPIIIANIHTAVFPFYFVLYLPYIAEYIIYKLSNSSILINKNRIKRLNNKLKKIRNIEKIRQIEEKIIQLEIRTDKLINRKEKKSSDIYKIKIVGNNNVKLLIIIMIICLLTGFLTPIKDTPYTYLIKTMEGNSTQNINEHLPLILAENLKFMIVIVIFIMILMFTDVKIKLSDLFMLAGLTLLTFYTRRQESMFILICVIVLNRLICALFNKYSPEDCNEIENWATRIGGMVITICFVLIISVINYRPKINDHFIDETKYPIMAADYILNNLDINSIKLYNEYNYGSYLLFRGIPVFIDSRADLYCPEFNEDINVFNDFLDLSGVNNDDIEKILDKYGITHLIMYEDAKLRRFIKQDEKKYTQIYEDDNFCIYERKQV